MGICTEHFECYAISNDEDENDIFYLHSESVILDRRQYSVSGSGDTVTTDITVCLIAFFQIPQIEKIIISFTFPIFSF